MEVQGLFDMEKKKSTTCNRASTLTELVEYKLIDALQARYEAPDKE